MNSVKYYKCVVCICAPTVERYIGMGLPVRPCTYDISRFRPFRWNLVIGLTSILICLSIMGYRWTGWLLVIFRQIFAVAYNCRVFYDRVNHWSNQPSLWRFPYYGPFVRGIHRSPVDSPHKGPVMRSFDVFFDVRLNKRLSKQSRVWWFGTPSRSLWRHCYEMSFFIRIWMEVIPLGWRGLSQFGCLF